jgi:hypothetical protein
MNKQQQLMEYATQDIISYIVEDNDADFVDAMQEFYASETCTKLFDEETGLYLESSAYVYDIFKNERQAGHLVQLEY